MEDPKCRNKQKTRSQTSKTGNTSPKQSVYNGNEAQEQFKTKQTKKSMKGTGAQEGAGLEVDSTTVQTRAVQRVDHEASGCYGEVLEADRGASGGGVGKASPRAGCVEGSSGNAVQEIVQDGEDVQPTAWKVAGGDGVQAGQDGDM